MPVSLQTVIVILAVGAAALYVGRSLLARKLPTPGCEACPASRSRKDDYT